MGNAGMRIELTVTPKEALAIGRDLAWLKAEKDRKILRSLTRRFLVKVFREAEASGRDSYRRGKHMLRTLYETGFEAKGEDNE
jgi:hypothetical protein